MHVIINILNYRRGIHKHLYNLKVNFNKGLVLESDFQTTQFKTVHNNISIIVCLTWIRWKKKSLWSHSNFEKPLARKECAMGSSVN